MSKKLHILIVEDNPADVNLMRDALPKRGAIRFDSESVPRLSEGIARLATGGIDLVMTDLGLPDSQGLATFRKLHQAAPDLAIIVLTGNDDQEMAVAAVREGAQDYLVKGQISGGVLVRAVRYALERKRTEKKLSHDKESLEEVNRKLEQTLEHTQLLASTDSLTNLYNYRRFFEMATREFRSSLRYQRQLTILMLDVDHFKHINDTFGHPIGDKVLVMVAQSVATKLRDIDLLARYGGDEFIILLPQTDAEQALPAAERIRDTVADLCVESDKGPLSVTLSIGIAEMWREPVDQCVESIVKRADRALYVAKAEGRNRITTYSQRQHREITDDDRQRRT
jgi:diguanylate cyclase (GGDEF)-like protein